MEKLVIDNENMYLLNSQEYAFLKDVYSFLNRTCYLCCFKHQRVNKLEISNFIKKMKGIIYE